MFTNILLKAGMAEAMDYAMANGEWTMENDIAAAIFFIGIPVIGIIIGIILVCCMLNGIYQFIKNVLK